MWHPRALFAQLHSTFVPAQFAGYEFAKKKLVEASGSYEAAVEHRTAIYLGGAAIAEFFADILLTPAEAVRIRLVSDRHYATNLATGFKRMATEGGLSELYAGFIPILAKQIPYAVGQFLVNELAHEAVYRQMSETRRANLTATEQTGITLGCGITAGVAAAVLSQPADTLLSQINKGQGGKGSAAVKLVRLAKEAGPVGLFAGLGPRIVRAGLFLADVPAQPAGVRRNRSADEPLPPRPSSTSLSLSPL